MHIRRRLAILIIWEVSLFNNKTRTDSKAVIMAIMGVIIAKVLKGIDYLIRRYLLINANIGSH